MNRIDGSRDYAPNGTQWLKTLKDGDHPAFTYGNLLELAEMISSFVERGLDQNEINVLFITRKQAERYIGYLKESGFEADKLLESQDIIIEPIDELLLQDQVGVITNSVKERLQAIGELARRNRKRGLNIVGEIAGTFAARGRYEDCVLVEMFWHALIPTFRPPITLICPFESIPAVLMGPLEELHNSRVPLEATWEITPASFDCVKCKAHVVKEIRVHEPLMMASQSEVATISMRENNAGLIPFCFDCISTHPILKPSWMRV
jgi:MEDS: MEthanogen/methylotroph, DcmR Sensory domain